MTTPNPTTGSAPQAGRRVLLWRADSDESHVEESLDRAASFLKVPAGAVAAAIDRGELVGDWFADWEAGGAA